MSDYKFPYWDDMDYWEERKKKDNKTFEDDGGGETLIED